MNSLRLAPNNVYILLDYNNNNTSVESMVNLIVQSKSASVTPDHSKRVHVLPVLTDQIRNIQKHATSHRQITIQNSYSSTRTPANGGGQGCQMGLTKSS